VDGTPVGREHQLLSVSVTKVVNRIASARLVYVDGSASSSDFPLSNGALFVPGKTIEVSGGAVDSPRALFTGVVVRHAIKVRDNAASQLIVECRHRATRLTVGERNAYHLDQTDSDAIAALLERAGVESDVEPTTGKHKQQVQFRCTDWDYLLARAQANGKLVLTNDATVRVAAPRMTDASVELKFGATILELDAEIDARSQFAAVQAVTWDADQQALVHADAADPGIAGPGNLTASDLSKVVGLDRDALVHSALTEPEAHAWADAQWLRSRLGKVSGRLKCEGLGTVNPGDTVKLSGTGERVSGDVFVTGVRHEFDTVQGWKTHLQFGAGDGWTPDEHPASTPKASGLLPGVNGLQTAIVVSNEDDAGSHRVRVRIPTVDSGSDGTWARVATLDAGDKRGFFFRPEIGDEVVVGFLDDDPRQPVLLGMLHSAAKAAPIKGSNDNHEKAYVSRSNMRLFFDDDKKVVRLETPAGNSLALSEDAKGITIRDQNGNKIALTPDGITIQSSKAIRIKAGTSLEAKSGTDLAISAGTSLGLDAASTAELKSSALTTVKGGMVQIN
jgi:Rhs element Vgr protein